MEVRQGVRADGEVQGGEIHIGGGVAVYGILRLQGLRERERGVGG